MKTYFAAFFLLGFFLFTSCKKEDNNATSNDVSGSWRVTLFTDSGNDETSDFSGYVFTFGDGGVLTVVNGQQSKTGKWSKSSNKFNVDLGQKSDSNKPLGELTDDWHIISINSTEIKLQDDNDSSNELLTFKKN